MFVRAKHSHWQNTDLQVKTSIVHLLITVEKERERERLRKKEQKKGDSGSVENNSCHTLFIQ